MKIQYFRYLLVFLILSSGVFFGQISCNKQADSSKPSQEIGKIIKLKIGKMTCESCAISAKIVLQRVKYVVKAEVQFSKKIGKVFIEKGKLVNVDNLIKALKKIGYTAKVISKINKG